MAQLYTDFDINFELNANGDIGSLSDEGAVRQVIKNSIQLNSFDIPFNNWYAANIKRYLFEHPNKITESEIKRSIEDVLKLDSRLKDPNVKITYSENGQFCYIDVSVYIVILDKTVNEQVKLDRAR